jgi:thiol-disulfide isomerase/thioredoxin
MNKRGNALVIVLIVVGVLALAGGIYYYSRPKTSGDLQRDFMKPDASDVEMESGGNEVTERDRYIEYTPEGYEIYKNIRRVLFFYANWCPTCRPADADFMKNETKIPEDVVVIRVNYNDSDTDNNEKELAEFYSVTYQHTFVQIDGDGNEITKWNGGQVADLLKNIK